MPVRTGISDGVYTEIVDGDLQAGQDVIVGVVQSGSAPPAARLR